MQATRLPLSSRAAAFSGSAAGCRSRSARASQSGRRGASVQAVLSDDRSLAPELQDGFNPIDPKKTGRFIAVSTHVNRSPGCPLGDHLLLLETREVVGRSSKGLDAAPQVPRVKNYGDKDLVPTPFCTTSVCSTARVAPRNAVNLHSAFVSDEDKVLLKSLAYGANFNLRMRQLASGENFGTEEHRLKPPAPASQGTRVPLAPASRVPMSATSIRSGTLSSLRAEGPQVNTDGSLSAGSLRGRVTCGKVFQSFMLSFCDAVPDNLVLSPGFVAHSGSRPPGAFALGPVLGSTSTHRQ